MGPHGGSSHQGQGNKQHRTQSHNQHPTSPLLPGLGAETQALGSPLCAGLQADWSPWPSSFFGAPTARTPSKNAPPFREAHLAGLQALKEAGTLVTLGPTEGITHVFGIFEAEDQAAVETLVKSDIYWREGIWTAVAVYPLIQAF